MIRFVRHKEGACATKGNRSWHCDKVPTLCNHFVTLSGGVLEGSLEDVTCAECNALLAAKPAKIPKAA